MTKKKSERETLRQGAKSARETLTQGTKSARETLTQCTSCPWRIDCEPDKDIPNGYCVTLHESLRKTIKSGLESIPDGRTTHMMACHYSKAGYEFACAGWIYNQIGPDNNIGVRLLIMRGQLPVPTVIGDQHETFDDTLPRPRLRGKRRR